LVLEIRSVCRGLSTKRKCYAMTVDRCEDSERDSKELLTDIYGKLK
jgi:hypothetical protein